MISIINLFVGSYAFALVLFAGMVLLFFLLAASYRFKTIRKYKKSTYYESTGNSYDDLVNDLGKSGEYLTYDALKEYEESGAKFLFNLYIPKKGGGTTELDVMMISPKGVFVFESKNYSGWIFGSEKQKYWYQTLPTKTGRSHKERFYNPVMQNQSHIRHLKALLGEKIPVWSIIVFSERCTLKSAEIENSEISIINRDKLASVVSTIYQIPVDLLSEVDVSAIYDELYPYSQVNEDVKEKHIESINEAYGKKKESEVVTAEKVALETAPEINMGEIENGVPTEALVCPKCGGELLLRTAKRGDNAGKRFYGCSNYPKCRYIYNLEK